MPVSVLVNGSPAGSVSVLDRGFAFGDGVFRTLRVAAGRPLNWRHHFRRLAADCATLGIPPPDEPALLREIAQVAQGDATAKIVVTRGLATRGYAPAKRSEPTRVVAAFEASAYPPSCGQEGVRVRRCRLVLSEQPRLAGAKTLNRLENVLARGEWDDTAIAEGLLADARDRLIGGTMSNVFVVKGDSIATPGLARCGVAGAQRERVLELLEARGCAVEIRDIAYGELEGADEMFLTNSLIGVWPVARLDDRGWVPGPRTRLVQRLVEEDDARVR